MKSKKDIESMSEVFALEMRRNNASNSHIKRRLAGLKILARELDNVPVKRITPEAVESAYYQLKKLNGSPYSDASMAGFREAWLAFFQWLESEGHIKRIDLRLKKFGYESNIDRSIPPHVLERVDSLLLDYAAYPGRIRDALIISLTADSGARIGEIHKITKKEIDRALHHPFQEWVETIDGTQAVLCYTVQSTGKTGGTAVMFHEKSAHLAKRWLGWLNTDNNVYNRSPYLFVSTWDGAHLHHNSMQTAFYRFFKFYGMPVYYPHSFRSGMVTAMDDMGVNTSVIASKTGHKSTKMIEQHYLKGKYRKARRASSEYYFNRQRRAVGSDIVDGFFHDVDKQ